MKEKIHALLVHDEDGPMFDLKLALERLGVATLQAHTCQEMRRHLWSEPAPHLVFTDTELPDGTWAEVIRLAVGAPIPVNVIVVSRVVDIRKYIQVLESGAFDFMTPPFEAHGLAYVVHAAAENVASRRAVHAHAA